MNTLAKNSESIITFEKARWFSNTPALVFQYACPGKLDSDQRQNNDLLWSINIFTNYFGSGKNALEIDFITIRSGQGSVFE